MAKKVIKIRPEVYALANSFAVLAEGNTVYCIDAHGIRWKKKFITTFYRDPYTDVKVSALDANEEFVAVGTNFMDGKLYLFDSSGKLLWEHQFATIASLGWRPEDVTNVSIGRDYVVASTRFMHDYVYAYTFKRERLFSVRFEEDILRVFAGKNTVVVTERGSKVFDREGRELYSTQMRVNYACDFAGLTVLCVKDVRVRDVNKISPENIIIPCNFAISTGKQLLIISENTVSAVNNSFEELWKIEVDKKILHAFCKKMLVKKIQTLSS